MVSCNHLAHFKPYKQPATTYNPALHLQCCQRCSRGLHRLAWPSARPSSAFGRSVSSVSTAMQSHVELQVPSGDAGSAPTKVLLFAPALLHATSGLALAFEGDSVLDPTAREDVGDALLQPEAHGRTLQAKLPRDHALAV